MRKYDRIYPNEYLCDGDDHFGLTGMGKLVFIVDGEGVWEKNTAGDFLALQDDGNLVVYKKRPDTRSESLWASDCFADDTTVKLEGSEVIARKPNGDVLWKINKHGEESGCNPSPDDDDDDDDVGTEDHDDGDDDGDNAGTEDPDDGDNDGDDEVNCKGSVLGSKKRLYPTQYICHKNDMFGLDNQGGSSTGKEIVRSFP